MRRMMMREQIFPKNYAEAWRDLNILRLQDFSSDGWETLLNRLIQLYAEAYQIDLPHQIWDKGRLAIFAR